MPATTPSTTRAPGGCRSPLGQEGAATLEFALSLLLFLPLLFGLSFVGETFSAGAKIQEAEIASAWEITAYQLHDYESPTADGRYSGTLTTVSNRVQDELRFSLNSFSGNNTLFGGSSTPGRALPYLSVTPITVDCRAINLPTERTAAETNFKPLLPYDAVASYMDLGTVDTKLYKNTVPASEFLHVYKPAPSGARNQNPTFYKNYVSCRASASVTQNLDGVNQDLQRFTAENGLLNGVAHQFSFCGIGDTLRGCTGSSTENAQGGLVFLTDDWALSDGTSNPLGSNDNASYFNVGESIYGGGVGAQTVHKAMEAMLGVDDQSNSNAFKFGMLDRLSDARSFSNDVGPSDIEQASAYLTPYDTLGGAPKQAYHQRANSRYLGNPVPTFEDAP